MIVIIKVSCEMSYATLHILVPILSKRKKKDLQNQPQTIKKMAIGTYMSIITLNVNGLNAPTKRHRLAQWIQKQDHIYAVYKKPTSDIKTHID